MKELKKGEKAKNVQLNAVDMWVQVYDVRNGFMTERLGKVTGNHIGTFIESDLCNFSGMWRNYMRIKKAISNKWLQYEPPDLEEDGSSDVDKEMEADQFSGDNQAQSKGRDKECNLSNDRPTKSLEYLSLELSVAWEPTNNSSSEDLVSFKRPNFIFLIETMVLIRQIEEMRKVLNFEDLFIVDPMGHSGGLALLWRER
ncbi:hypothetical protein GH714_022977 [Hevea brasiliensis]|uniref:Uncharacterized protein n=1 Tax=Hevea brasiliensis TaxID=3981 RepID=A0A6A6M6K3_HEVBR|nr:hypothetical protein GH714_022977 [Hevea brasiliensis]